MGGKSRTTTVGYKYFLGMHLVLCESPIDAVVQIAASDRTFWAGRKASGRISVAAPTLFGGRGREGGVGGFIDVESGAVDQPVNDYLAGRLGALTPAFRGVVGLVFRRFYFGNNPYFQPLRVKVQAVQQTYENWLPGLAPIGAELNFDKVAIHLAIDQSGSMSGARQSTLKAALQALISQLPDSSSIAVRILPWGEIAGSAIERFGMNAAARTALSDFVAALPSSGALGGTNFVQATAGAATFFTSADAQLSVGNAGFVDFAGAASGASTVGEASSNDAVRRVFVLVTDGAASGAEEAASTLAAIPRIETLGINIELEDTSVTAVVDAVAGDGVVPVVSGDNPGELAEAIYAGFTSHVDLNGVHILRDVFINPRNGGLGDADLIGDSFAAAAQQAFDEGMGFSFRWRAEGDVDSFKQLVERHLDAATWLDPVTGKYEIRLIRPDYEVDALTTFGVGGVPVVEWFDPEQPDPGELPNQVVVTYTRRDNGEKSAVTATNVAAVVSSGRIVSHKVTYEGVTRSALAAKLAERDLFAKSQPIVKGGFRAAYLPAGLNLGSAIIVNEPRLGLVSLVGRITEIEEPDGVDNSVVVRFAQDVWGTDLELDPVVGEEAPPGEDLSARAANVLWAEELPYYELVRQFGQSDVDAELGEDEGYGLWAASADQPNDLHIGGQVLRFDDPLWIDLGATSLMPSWVLSTSLSASAAAVEFSAPVNNREGAVPAGAILQIDEELMRIDSIAVANGVATFTVGRGVLDTVPSRHALGARAYIWQDFNGSDAVEYSEGQTVEVTVLPRTSSGMAAIDAAGSRVVTFASRASRPYPVGKLQLDGSYLPSGPRLGSITATWTHRDRLFQTYADLDDHTAESIGPEAGVAYVAVAREVYLREDVFAGSAADWFDSRDFFLDDLRGAEDEQAVSPAQALTWDFDIAEPSPAWGADLMRLEFGIRTVRGVSNELENWQTPFVMVAPLLPVLGLSGVQLDGPGGGSAASGGSA